MTETSGDADEADILEIDAPRRAYFEIPIRGESLGLANMGADDVAFIERICYQSFVLIGSTAEDVKARRDTILAAVRAEIAKCGGGIIWWRKRPELIFEGTEPRVRMRLGTSPGMSAMFWQGLAVAVEDCRRRSLAEVGS